MATCSRGGSGTSWGIGGAKSWLVPNLHPGGHPRGKGAPGVPATPGEPQYGARSPTSSPARLLPRCHGLGTVGTELGQGCTQTGEERLGARVPLEASCCHPRLWHQGIAEEFWGERSWGTTRGARTGSLRQQGDVGGVTAQCQAVMGAGTLQLGWDVGGVLSPRSSHRWLTWPKEVGGFALLSPRRATS